MAYRTHVYIAVIAALLMNIVGCEGNKSEVSAADLAKIEVDPGVFAAEGDIHLPKHFNPTRDVVPLGGYHLNVNFLVQRHPRIVKKAAINQAKRDINNSTHEPWSLRLIDKTLNLSVAVISSAKLTKAEFTYAWLEFLKQKAPSADWVNQTHLVLK